MATIQELSRQYRRECAKLRIVIEDLKNVIPTDGRTWHEIERRRRILEEMLRELRDISQYLEHYDDATAREFYYNLSGMKVVNVRDGR
ncbi:MAG: hypothetical protein RR394_09475 [Oscillospiraceae bacterium]